MAKIKKPSPFKTQTLAKAKDGTTKIQCCAFCANVEGYPVLWYFVKENDGFYEKAATEDEARALFDKKVSFGKHQLKISI